MTREEFFELAQRHSDVVWPAESAIGEGHLVLERFRIESEDATQLALQLAGGAVAMDTLAGQAALFLQGLIFGLWLSEQVETVL